MARFDVYAYSDDLPFVLDVQANLFADLHTRVVVPLLHQGDAPPVRIPQLNPVITIADERYVMMTMRIAAVSAVGLGEPVVNLEEGHRQEITSALDFLFQGF